MFYQKEFILWKYWIDIIDEFNNLEKSNRFIIDQDKISK
jgi:hypothetical protein